MAPRRGKKRKDLTKADEHSQAALESKRRTAKRISIHAHLVSLGDFALSNDQPKGACLVPDPQTGEQRCTIATQELCGMLKGTWVGGMCGGD